MFEAGMVQTLVEGVRDTLYMVLASTAFGYLLGLPLGILLCITGENGIRKNPVIYRILDIVVNLIRSVPFLILLILVSPFTKWLVGKSYGATATVVSLVIAAAPFIARMVESSLNEVDQGVIEAAKSMGATDGTIIFKVLIGEARTSLLVGVTIALGTILGYSAMAGVLGGGGLGDIAIRYGYYRWQGDVMWVTVILLVALVQILQGIGMLFSKKLDHRRH